MLFVARTKSGQKESELLQYLPIYNDFELEASIASHLEHFRVSLGNHHSPLALYPVATYLSYFTSPQ
jgi:hypothetical protein